MQILKVPYLIPFEMTKAFSGFFRKNKETDKVFGPMSFKKRYYCYKKVIYYCLL